MGGDGAQPLQMPPPPSAEEQYVKAKTSVWWDIENCHVPKSSDPHAIAQNISSALVKMNYCGPVSISAYGDTTRISPSVQQALNSTGVALNHVPAGVKDASDKKILVDMLFWAVDNPAPANYLLISGDRDFSNALHQLRMRRYNILLAQPQKASAALIAAAKSVWLWTSLSAGGLPLTNSESVQFVTNGNVHLSVTDSSYTDSSKANQPLDSFHESPHLGNKKFSNMGRETDANYKGKQTRRIGTQPIIPRTPNFMPRPDQDYNNSNFRTAYGPPKQSSDSQDISGTYKVANSNIGSGPSHITGIPDSSWTSNNYAHGSHENQYPQPLRSNGLPVDHASLPNQQWHTSNALPHRLFSPNLTSVPPTYVPDVSNLNISEPPKNDHKSFGSQQRNGGEGRKTSVESPNCINLNGAQKGYNNNAQKKYVVRQEAQTSKLPHGVWGTPGCPEPSDYVQCLMGIVLLALNTLRNEKIMPTEENITDCVRYGDVKNRNTDVKKALTFALQQQLVVRQQVGSLQLYVAKNQKLWQCVNPMAGDANKFPKSTWDDLQKFLSSTAGRSAIMETQCRYEAAIVMKKMCLKELSLGETLQILQLIVNTKKWITYNYQSGWKPIKVTVAEVNPTPGLAAAT